MSVNDGEMVSREDVIMAYRLLLGREPESIDVIDHHCSVHRSLHSLRTAFLSSPEFRASQGQSKASFLDITAHGYWAEPKPVEIRVTPEIEARLAERIRDQWTKLGEDDPHWSVLTDERFRAAVIDADAQAAFRETGRDAARLIDLVAQRTAHAMPTGTCIELGCGVGRITRFLANRFEQVIAVDISAGNLALCDRYMAEEGIRNVQTLLIRSIDDLAALPACDMFYSIIVLQHNPPPIQYRMLTTLLAKIVPGGACLFQTVADLEGYGFDATSYLESPSPPMEIHSLPMPVILTMLREADLVVDSVRSDPWIDGYGSYTFSARRASTDAVAKRDPRA